MPAPRFLMTPEGRRIAYDRQDGREPGVVFLHGFRSDMTGNKAEHLAGWARETGRAVLRFDYSGHGQSSGRFEDGAIGDWFADALAVIGALTQGPQVIVGSSMGGWIGLLVAEAMPARVHGFVGIAAAPDFTEDGMWSAATDAERAKLLAEGRIVIAPEDGGTSWVITRRLIEEGRDRLVLRRPLHLPFPVRLLHGTADADVPMTVPLRLVAHATGPDMRLTLVKDADHRFSSPACLGMITAAVADVLR